MPSECILLLEADQFCAAAGDALCMWDRGLVKLFDSFFIFDRS